MVRVNGRERGPDEFLEAGSPERALANPLEILSVKLPLAGGPQGFFHSPVLGRCHAHPKKK